MRTEKQTNQIFYQDGQKDSGASGKIAGRRDFAQTCYDFALKPAFEQDRDVIFFFGKSARGYGLLSYKMLEEGRKKYIADNGLSEEDVKTPKVRFVDDNPHKDTPKFIEMYGLKGDEKLLFFDESSKEWDAPSMASVNKPRRRLMNDTNLDIKISIPHYYGKGGIERDVSLWWGLNNFVYNISENKREVSYKTWDMSVIKKKDDKERKSIIEGVKDKFESMKTYYEHLKDLYIEEGYFNNTQDAAEEEAMLEVKKDFARSRINQKRFEEGNFSSFEEYFESLEEDDPQKKHYKGLTKVLLERFKEFSQGFDRYKNFEKDIPNGNIRTGSYDVSKPYEIAEGLLKKPFSEWDAEIKTIRDLVQKPLEEIVNISKAIGSINYFNEGTLSEQFEYYASVQNNIIRYLELIMESGVDNGWKNVYEMRRAARRELDDIAEEFFEVA
jgi:hypothetical protein